MMAPGHRKDQVMVRRLDFATPPPTPLGMEGPEVESVIGVTDHAHVRKLP